MQRVVPKAWRRPSVSFVRYYDDDVTAVAPPPSPSSPRPLPPRPRKRADSATTLYAKVPPRPNQVEEVTLLAIDVLVEQEPVTTVRMLLGAPEPRRLPPSLPYMPRYVPRYVRRSLPYAYPAPPAFPALALPEAAPALAPVARATRPSMLATALMVVLTLGVLAFATPRLHRLVTHSAARVATK